MNEDQKKPRRPRKQPSPPGTKRKKIAAAFKALRGRPRKEAAHRDADRQALVAAAFDMLREGGSAALTVRSVAARTGTAVGSVYTAFPSLDALRLEVNAVTMGLLRDCLAQGLAGCTGRSLEQRLLCLADAYTRFADDHGTLWAALFEPRTLPVPPALSVQVTGLFTLLEGVLRETGCAPQDLPLLARALWASVHGTVFLAGSGSLGPIGRADAPSAVHALIRVFAAGLASGRTEDDAT